MKYVIKKSKNKPVKLFPIRKSEFAETVENQSEYVQNYVKSSRQKGDLGDIFSIRNPDGIIEEVLYVIDDTINIWSFACLPKKLPEGDYEIHGDFNKKESTDIAAGWEIGTYKFDKYKEIKNGYARLVVPKNADIDEAQNVAEATFLVRNLINTPTCDMGTKELAQAAIDIAHKYKCSYNVISDSELLDEGYNSIYTVGKASTKRPCLVDIQWGDPDDAKITIVGKGVCFDTGGLNIKGESNIPEAQGKIKTTKTTKRFKF
jgi:leucyl aminopeptidase